MEVFGLETSNLGLGERFKRGRQGTGGEHFPPGLTIGQLRAKLLHYHLDLREACVSQQATQRLRVAVAAPGEERGPRQRRQAVLEQLLRIQVRQRPEGTASEG